MGIDIRETLLPGVGLRYEFDNADGDRVCVIATASGRVPKFFVSTAADPDRAQRVFRLTDSEADALAQILGAPRMVESFADLSREVPGLEAEVEVLAASATRTRPLGDTRARTRTGASVVAIVRGDGWWPRPAPMRCCAPRMCWWSSVPPKVSVEFVASSIRQSIRPNRGYIRGTASRTWSHPRRSDRPGGGRPPLRAVADPALSAGRTLLGDGGIPVPEAAEFLETGASIGVVLLLLTLGLEFSVVEFTASLRRHTCPQRSTSS